LKERGENWVETVGGEPRREGRRHHTKAKNGLPKNQPNRGISS